MIGFFFCLLSIGHADSRVEVPLEQVIKVILGREAGRDTLMRAVSTCVLGESCETTDETMS